MLHGLVYLHKERRTIHRDIKPSNLLVDAAGNVKIADFGVSGELGHTLAKCASWVGTVHYMSPERIQGSAYSYDSDVWSLGITLLELATGAFPYPPERDGRRLSFWDLLDAIVESPPPTPPSHFAPQFHSFIGACLQKEPARRASSSQLLHHPLLASATAVDLPSLLSAALANLPPRGSQQEELGGTELADGGAPMMGEGGYGEPALGGTLNGGASGFGGGGGLGGGGFGGDPAAAAMLASIMGGGTVQRQPPVLRPAPSFEMDIDDAPMQDA